MATQGAAAAETGGGGAAAGNVPGSSNSRDGEGGRAEDVRTILKRKEEEVKEMLAPEKDMYGESHPAYIQLSGSSVASCAHISLGGLALLSS